MDAQFPVLRSSKPLKPGSEEFQKIPLTTNFFKLGRGHHNTVIIPYKCLSKDHCIFKKVEEQWMIENCSYSSIKVNGSKVRKGETHKLSDQDIIKLESSNELVYTFMATPKTSKRKRCKLDDELLNDSNNRKKSGSPKTRTPNGIAERDIQTAEEQILSEQSKKEKEIYDDYAARIEKLKGSKKIVKRQKALLKMRRNAQLELIKVKMEERMAFLMGQEKKPLYENKPSKELSNHEQGDQKSRSKETLDQSEARREQDRLRVKEQRELKKLRRETRRLKLDKEKKLKELEKQKMRREQELQEELNKVNKKLAKERELHEKEKRRVEQLLNQKKEDLKKVSPSTSSDSKLDMGSELECSICSELFVRATTLGCSHSFCRYCIRKWTANKKECPICRAPITSECRSIVLDSLVDKMAQTAHAKKKRQQLVKNRDELEAKEPATEPNRGSQQNALASIIPDFMYDETSDSSYHGRESSLEPDSDMLVPMTDSEPSSGFDGSDVSSVSDAVGQFEDEHYEEIGMEYGEYESDNQENGENYDEAPENEEEEEHDGDSAENYGPDDENYGPDDENYDEGDSPSEQEEHDTEDITESEESAPENYDEGENSASENYDEGDNSAPEHDGDENSEPEHYDGDISEPENYELEHSEPDNYEGENSEPENYDEGENSEPENYDEGENSEPENYDEGENSAPEYDGESYPDDDGDYY